ncbi:DNA double-strand break repair nuclease NurA [Halobaculum sp. CBA1158]|uniref:DNA double-strand break repair nuclease NurA n=1 Tax=Halobaculum sp. CBA1158 TaxID=2904243 RepID=UPI001F28C54B|nr:DNA double-strand break repair nuclease NurA [Halobaculum sp. CBA1158]UIP00876.1 DNA double-strand break repair nuclease NurA [Halobaculum sp. CBA1158]
MTLDPVHVDTIAYLASAIADGVDDADHDDLAGTAWDEWLDPLHADGREVLAALGEHELRRTPVEDAALADRPFETSHGVDSGTLNPTSFKNGLVLDVAQAAMGTEPTDLDLHRGRSIVVTVHANDATVVFPDVPDGWMSYDEGNSDRRVLKVPRSRRFADEMVHELALSLAESHHARRHLDHGDVEDLLVLDGPLYPKRLLNWATRDRELREVAHGETVQEAVETYVRLVESCIERGVPVLGFVKNPTSGFLTRTLDRKGIESPWPDDAALFTRLLERRAAGPDDRGGPGDRDDDSITFTSWLRSRGGSDAPLASDGDALGVERRLDPAGYEVTYMHVYEPREDVLFKVEAPAAFTEDPETRDRLTRQVISEVAAEAGPPTPVAKADELARIGVGEKEALRRKFEERFGAEHLRTYDDVRWQETE